MDSPHLLHLSFLLLALAAPHSNTAMSTAGPAGETEGSSPGSINVTVFHCKDCKSCPCKSVANDFKNFTKIAEAQTKRFSDEITLVTSETHITVCFKQANSCLEGVYGVFWEKAEGARLSCGILNSGEIGRDNISTEKNICCKAETNVWKHNPALECYIQKSFPKHAILPPDIPGNPEFLTSKKSNTGTLFAFLFVVVCAGWVTMYCFLWLRRRGQAFRQDIQTPDKENLIHL